MSGVRNTVICSMCGGKFFPASLKFHEKACKKKQQYLEIPCSYCDEMVRKTDMDIHLRRCPERKASERRQRKGGGGMGGGVGGLRGAVGRIELGTGADQLMGSKSLSSLGSGRGAGGGGGARYRQKAVHEETTLTTMQAPTPGADGRIPCAVCGRKFAADRIGIHQKICRKIKSKGEPEVYDISARRTQEIKDQLPPQDRRKWKKKLQGGPSKGSKFINPATRFGGKGSSGIIVSHIDDQSLAKKKNNWRSQHESFIANIRNAKKISNFMKNGGEAKDLASLPLLETKNDEVTNNYVHCKHCGRTFSEIAGARHIPKCENIINKPKPPPGGGFKLNRGSLPMATYGTREHRPKWGR